MRNKAIISGGGGVLGFVLAIVIGIGPMLPSHGANASAQLATAAPEIPVVQAAAPVNETQTPPPPVVQPAAAPVDPTSHFSIDPGQSGAKIFISQSGILGATTSVANGSGVNGDVFLSKMGVLGDGSNVNFDLRTLRSPDSSVNSFLTSDGLQANQFPYAQFVIQSVDGIPSTYTDGNEFTFTMTGLLTMHGVTRQVTWTARGRQAGEFLSVLADTDFNMTDFNWTPPNYGIQKVNNKIHMQVSFIARSV